MTLGLQRRDRFAYALNRGVEGKLLVAVLRRDNDFAAVEKLVDVRLDRSLGHLRVVASIMVEKVLAVVTQILPLLFDEHARATEMVEFRNDNPACLLVAQPFAKSRESVFTETENLNHCRQAGDFLAFFHPDG